MKSDFRLVGLSKPASATLNLLHTDKEIFWAPFDMPKDRFDALFNWAKNDDTFWKDKKIAEVEFERLSEDGIPINGKVTAIREWDI